MYFQSPQSTVISTECWLADIRQGQHLVHASLKNYSFPQGSLKVACSALMARLLLSSGAGITNVISFSKKKKH